MYSKLITYLLIVPILYICLPVHHVSSKPDTVITTFSENIYPGDVFVINVNSKNAPTGQFQGRSVNFYRNNGGYKALGFVDFNTEPAEYPLTVNLDNERVNYNITVKLKEFPVKNITLKSEKVFLSPENEKRANAEEAVLKSIWNRIAPYPLWTDNFIKPISSDITSPFGVKRE